VFLPRSNSFRRHCQYVTAPCIAILWVCPWITRESTAGPLHGCIIAHIRVQYISCLDDYSGFVCCKCHPFSVSCTPQQFIHITQYCNTTCVIMLLCGHHPCHAVVALRVVCSLLLHIHKQNSKQKQVESIIDKDYDITLIAKLSLPASRSCVSCGQGVRLPVPLSVVQWPVSSLVLQRLDYGNATLGDIPSHLIKRMQSAMNSAAWLVLSASRYDRITPQLTQLH